MSVRILGADPFRWLLGLFRRSSPAASNSPANPASATTKQGLIALAALGLWLFNALQPVQAALLTRDDIEKLLDGQFIVGEVQPDMPVYPLFAKGVNAGGKPELRGYAFESLDFEPVRGYSGKPIDVLVAMDLTGAFIDLRLVDHKEPFFNNPTGTKRLGVFTAQYTRKFPAIELG